MLDKKSKKLLLCLSLLFILGSILIIYNIRKNAKKIRNKRILILDFSSHSKNPEQLLSLPKSDIHWIKINCYTSNFSERISLLLKHIHDRHKMFHGILVKTDINNNVITSNILERFVENNSKPLIVFTSHLYENFQTIRNTNINKVMVRMENYLVEPKYFHHFHHFHKFLVDTRNYSPKTIPGVYHKDDLIFQSCPNQLREIVSIPNPDIKFLTLSEIDDVEYILSLTLDKYYVEPESNPDVIILDLGGCIILSKVSKSIISGLIKEGCNICILNNPEKEDLNVLQFTGVNMNIVYPMYLFSLSIGIPDIEQYVKNEVHLVQML